MTRTCPLSSKHKCSTSTLFLSALILSTFGYVLEYNQNNSICKYIYFLTAGTRNGLFQGYSFFIIGVIIKRQNWIDISETRKFIYLLAAIIIYAIASFLPVTKGVFMYHIACGLLFIFLMNQKVSHYLCPLFVRKLGIWIYFTHMYVVFMIRQVGNEDFWCLVSLATPLAVALGLLLEYFSRRYTILQKLM